MTDTVIAAGLIKLAPSILSAICKKGLEKLFEDPPIAKAINDTDEAFPGFPAISDQLTKWCSSGEFVRLFEALQAGERDVTDDSIVSEFIRIADFVCEANPAKAKEIVEYFIDALLTALHSSDQGTNILASREEVQHDATRAEIQKISTKIEILTGIDNKTSEDGVEKVKISEKEFHARIDEARALLLEEIGRAHV